MKMDINEIHFVKEALNGCTIKIKDATFASTVLQKLDKEFDRLQVLESKK